MNEHKPLQTNFKQKQRKAVLKLVALLLVVATLISTAAWSWFTDNQEEVTANGIQFLMSSQEAELEISLDGGVTWRNSLDIFEDTNFMNDLDMVPLTGQGFLHGGEMYLYIPELLYSGDGKATVSKSAKWDEPVIANKHYISLKIMFRTKEPADVYIGAGTSVITESKKLIGEDCGNPSLHGSFSRDAIVGALRMSLAAGSEDNLSFIWIPRPDIKLVEVGDGKYDLVEVEKEDPWTGKHAYFTKDTDRVGATRFNCPQSSEAFTATYDDCKSANSRSRVGTTAIDGSDSGYAYCTAYINIWVDGEDAEAKRALSRGRFRIQINFVADKKNGSLE